MRILFLHLNFPGQFRHIAQALAAEGHDVAFLCQTHYGRELPKVKRFCLKGNLGHQALQEQGGNQLHRTQLAAKQYRCAMVKLDSKGWRPHVVVSHSGWGCGLHVKELWPKCRHVSYLEWWFDPQSELLNHDPQNPNLGWSPKATQGFWIRNQPLALELACADAVVAPTEWQRLQLPQLLRDKCKVIYDGVDLERFYPDLSHRSTHPLITYGTRGMEPMRSFPEFIRELPSVLDQWSNARVEIAGNEGIYYGGKCPQEGNWKIWAEKQLHNYMKSGQVRWKGYLDGQDYVRWLQSSWYHVYLTQPFIASWSLAEAIACGCTVIASDVGPIQEFTSCGNLTLVDSRRTGFLLKVLQGLYCIGAELAQGPLLSLNCQALSIQAALSGWRKLLK